MSSTAPRLTLALLGVLLVPRLLSGDVIHLRNGNSIEVQTWRRAGDFVEYYHLGGLVSIRSSEVLRIESPREGPPVPEAVAPVPAGTGETGEAANAQMLGRAFRALSAGDIKSFVSHFRYVDDPKWPDERSELTRVFSLLRDRLGRPDSFEAVSTTSSRFLNVRIESATPDEWRRSDCLFKNYAFKTALVEGRVHRPAEVIVEVCRAQTATRSWLRKVDFRFLEQDPKVAQTLQEIVQAVPVARRPKDIERR